MKSWPILYTPSSGSEHLQPHFTTQNLSEREKWGGGGGEWKSTTDLETKLEMKEAGLLDLKARRKDHMLPRKGQPKSPGGREYCLLPSRFYDHKTMNGQIHYLGQILSKQDNFSMVFVPWSVVDSMKDEICALSCCMSWCMLLGCQETTWAYC